MMIKVKEVMSDNVCSVLPSATIGEVALQMKKLNVGCMPVCTDRGFPKGVITDRDLVLSIASSGSNSFDIMKKAEEMMTTRIIKIDKEASVHEAALLMSKNKVRRLLVTQGEMLIGILSLGDIASQKIFLDEAGDVLGAISKKETTS